jgi:thymidine phosphorylase
MAEKLHGLDTMEGEESQQEDDVDSLLDVFKEEQVSDSPISALARSLEETDMYSLLEEAKWIANMVRGASTESNQAP